MFKNNISVSFKIVLKFQFIPTIPHKNNETNDKFYWKVAFLMYTEMVNFRPQNKNHTEDCELN